MEFNEYFAKGLAALGISFAVAVAVYITHSTGPLCALLFILFIWG